ncbi:MAG: hypothetical protein JWO38_6264 [Gemmataceae bacterium]|nr:hypothetical protein [Gemmataceae bacterium]
MIHLLSYTEVGGHRVNEDVFVARSHPADPDCQLGCLADGQGGRAGGGRAAQLACETAVAAASQYPPAELFDPLVWQSVLAQADTVVAADLTAGLTTLIGLCVRGDQLAGASSGDSAVVTVGPRGSQELTAHQFKNPPVGSGGAIFVPFETSLTRPWRVLAMSDGVWNYAGWDRVTAAGIRTGGRELLAQLQEAARLRGTGGFPDDFTLILLETPV